MTTTPQSPTPGAKPADDNDNTDTHELLYGIDEASIEPARPKAGVDWVIFGVTATLAIAFLIWGFTKPKNLESSSKSALDWVMQTTDWLFVLSASGFVVFALWLAASRFGNIPLGGDNERPEFRTSSWIAMMFSAGMGIGLMFFGVAEPLMDYITPVPGTGVDPQTDAAMRQAMATTLFHWSLHPWAIYAVVGVAIAYGTFRKGRTQLISSAFRSLLGPRVDGPIGKIIDMLAIFATLFGSAASLGVGALQIQAGLQEVGWVDKMGRIGLVVLIGVLTLCFILSAVSGVARGIQWLSNINMVLALLLAVFVFVVGPTIFILDLLPTTLGTYFADLPTMASRTQAAGGPELQAWLSGWTVFYWAWWMSWTPFVGMFIARISRGRTIRQFVSGVLLVPSLVSLVWFAVFGGAAIDQQRQTKDMVDAKGAVNSDTALFDLLSHYPMATVTAVLVMLLVAIFFVSGADAASIVMGTLSERGTIEPTRKTVIFWGVATGGVAASMLMAGIAEGDPSAALDSLQNVVIVSALPFAIVMILMCVALVRDLQQDPLIKRAELGQAIIEQAVIGGVAEHGHDDLALVVTDAGDDDTNGNRTLSVKPAGATKADLDKSDHKD